ncbi:tyrosine-type recombinase/integrase [Glycomyces sp. NPDC048151]|uniref:tyrosine-type recombinase/integrase n=1 Tax=Glycomyces sp. NPDC048151 TaxID=3364002 RepID=UPI0037184478
MYVGVDPETGKQRYLTETCRNPDEAEAARVRMVAQADSGKGFAGRLEFGDAIKLWLASRDEYVAAGELAASSQRNSRQLAETHVIPVLGAIALGDLERELVPAAEALYREVGKCRLRCRGRTDFEHYEPGRGNARIARDLHGHQCGKRCRPHECPRASASMLRKVHSVVTGTCGMLHRWGWMPGNTSKRIVAPAKPPLNPKAPTTVEVAALVDAAFARNQDWGTIVWLLLVTGARRSEIVRSQLKHVDFERSLIFIDPTKVKDTSRWLALDPVTMDLLEALRARITDRLGALGRTVTGEEYLYSFEPDHALHGSAGYLSLRLKSMGRSIGIDTHTHALRHYAATELIVGGVDIVNVAHRLGHRSPKSTSDIYAAWRPDVDRRAAALLAGGLQAPAAKVPGPDRDRSAEQPRRTAHEIEQRIREVRQRTGWGPRRIKHHLAVEGVIRAESTIWKILHRHEPNITRPPAAIGTTLHDGQPDPE